MLQYGTKEGTMDHWVRILMVKIKLDSNEYNPFVESFLKHHVWTCDCISFEVSILYN
jgi:hypothetical protein